LVKGLRLTRGPLKGRQGHVPLNYHFATLARPGDDLPTIFDAPEKCERRSDAVHQASFTDVIITKDHGK
jgi:hypothetical protein